MPLPILAKKVKKLASLHILNIKLLLNGRGFAKFKKQYRLTGQMGQGGFGVVYRAVRIVDDLPVAVKFIERRHVREWGKLNDERVPMEICMLARCSKIPGVIQLFDWFNLPEGFFIVMERPTPCVDLFDFIHNQRILSEDLARFIFRQIVKTAIDCADRKILHRDIKDENIVIDLASGETRLVDFGAATILRKTRYHDFQGTRLYCPPEWFLHSLYLGKEATVWSLGVLLYNMLNGKLPFHNEKDICTAHLLGPLPFFAKLSFGARHLIEKCLSFDPFDRPSLERILSHEWMCLPTPDWMELSASTSISHATSFDESAAMGEIGEALFGHRKNSQDKKHSKIKLELPRHKKKSLHQQTDEKGISGFEKRIMKCLDDKKFCQEKTREIELLEANSFPDSGKNVHTPTFDANNNEIAKTGDNDASSVESGLESYGSANSSSSNIYNGAAPNANERKNGSYFENDEEEEVHYLNCLQHNCRQIINGGVVSMGRMDGYTQPPEKQDTVAYTATTSSGKDNTFVARRNAKTSLLKCPSSSALFSGRNDDDDNREKHSAHFSMMADGSPPSNKDAAEELRKMARVTLQQIQLLKKKSGGASRSSADSGTSSVVASPRFTSATPYIF